MKNTILKYTLLFVVCLTSGYSYLYLNDQSILLNENQIKYIEIVKQDINTNKENGSLNTIGKESRKNISKEKTYTDKQKNDLPDVELLEYIIRKATEGSPLLKFDGFWDRF